jgi:hypothetical protein
MSGRVHKVYAEGFELYVSVLVKIGVTVSTASKFVQNIHT